MKPVRFGYLLKIIPYCRMQKETAQSEAVSYFCLAICTQIVQMTRKRSIVKKKLKRKQFLFTEVYENLFYYLSKYSDLFKIVHIKF